MTIKDAPKTRKATGQSTKDDNDLDSKKRKRLPFNWSVTCWWPMCAEKIRLNDNMDPDVELARHLNRKHDHPLPLWAKPTKAYEQPDKHANKKWRS